MFKKNKLKVLMLVAISIVLLGLGTIWKYDFEDYCSFNEELCKNSLERLGHDCFAVPFTKYRWQICSSLEK
jgi:hypothetical protein